jgi:pimeloyl-ACP methyl ester carboxylesterase
MPNTYPDPPTVRGVHPQAGGRARHTGAVIGRRTLLAAGLGGLAAGLSGCSAESGAAAAGVVTETHSFTSAARGGRRTAWSIVRPAQAADPLPIVVALHGLGQDHSILRSLGAAAALAASGHAFAVVAPDGGTSYWHPHRGEDAGAMVTDELLPRLADLGLRAAPTDRIGLLGWSMGGYGALRLAARLGPSRVVAVAAVSPALWTDPASASRSGFDDAADYRRNSIMGRQHELDGIEVRVDCGFADPFANAVRVYRDGFTRRPSGGFSFGNHDRAYWRRVLPADLAFLGRAVSGVPSQRD